MRSPFFVLFVIVLILISCQKNPKKSQEFAQLERILKLHDEVMPEMGNISRLIDALERDFQSDSTQIALNAAVAELKSANSAMIQWMIDFSETFTTDEITGKIMISMDKQSILDSYEVSALSLKEKILSAIKQANAVMNE